MPMATTSSQMDQTAPKGLSELMTQSTIYKRNEARLAKSYALKNDTRPAVVRVLAALSLSSRSSLQHGSQPIRQVIEFEPGFSQKTVFASANDSLATSSAGVSQSQSPMSSVFLSTSFAGAASQAIFGARSTAGSMVFQHNESKIALFALEGHANSTDVTMPVQKQMAVKSKTFHSQIAASAAISGILFGSKIAFARSLGDNENKPFASTSLASSALAGAAKATLSIPLQSIRSFQTLSPRSLNFSDAFASIVRSQGGVQGLYNGSRNAFSGEIIGAIIYFSTYEAAKSYLAPANDGKPTSSLVVGISGAFAGLVYQTALHEFARCNRTANLQSLFAAQQRVLCPSFARAVPIHATLFLCYEAALATRV